MNIARIPYTLGDYFDVIRRRWMYLSAVLPASLLLAVYLAYTLPPLYRSTGTILLEPSSIPEDMIRTTVTTYASQQLELVWRRIFTTDNLADLVDRLDPYPEAPELSRREKAQLIADDTSTQRVDPLTMEPLVESNAFSVSYLSESPELAQAVTQELVQMFLDFNRVSRTEQATENYSFLKVRSEDAKRRIEELEQRLAQFRGQYGEALPEARARNQQALDRVQRDLDGLELQILVTEERKRTLELQLSQINPNLFDPAGDWRSELATLRAQLAEARQRYTENHPDVRRLQRSIEAMSARAAVSPSEVTAPDNPDYIQVASQLDTVTRELSVLHSRAGQARAQIAAYERSFQIAPEVEREYSQLIRDYEVARQRFKEIEDSLSEAALAQVLEAEQRGNRYTLIRPPNRPTTPDSPNRRGIILLALVLGTAVAVGLAALAESSDPSIRSPRDLAEITDIQPLGAVPVILNAADKRMRLLAWGAASVIVAVAVSFVTSAVA